MSNMTAEQKVTRARIALMNDPDWRWMAGVMMLGNTTYTDDDSVCPTAGTDGVNEVWNRKFLANLSHEEAKGTVLHENYHKILRHLHVYKNLYARNAKLANIAADAVINNQQLAGKAGIALPKGVVDMPQYADTTKWNTATIFEDLMEGGKGSGGGKPMPGDSLDKHDWEGASEMTEAEEKALAQQIDMALRQAAMAGTMAGGLPREIKEMLVPDVDWRSELAEFVKSVVAGDDKQTWRKPHRTYIAHDLYMPSPYSESIGRLLIAGDTSGSIGNEMLSLFLGHMQHLCNEVNPNGVDIAWWDTEVAGVDRFERGNMGNLASAVKPAGGGGTDPSVIPAWIRKEKTEYVCAVVITDGEFNGVGNWDIPVLWLVVNNSRVPNIPVGRVIHVKELR